MGLFDKLTKAVKEGLNEFVDKAKERPQFYINVELLISQIETLQEDKKLKNSPEVQDALQAATALKNTLVKAKDDFDKVAKIHNFFGPTSMNAHEYHAALHKFCETSVNAIHQHQSTLMAAPGIWNKLKACINNVLEEYLGIKDALEIKENKIATSGSDFKNRFENVKSEGKKDMEEIEDHPLRPDIK